MPKHELVLSGGQVADGTGSPLRPADVAVDSGRITAIGDRLEGKQTLDCKDLVVCPGFIDTHSHSDLRVLVEPTLPMKLKQGITLEFLGQDGISVAPLKPHDIDGTRAAMAGLLGEIPVERWTWSSVADFLDAIEDAGPAMSMAFLVPHGTLRVFVMGLDDRAPTDTEMGEMKRQLQVGLDEGAFGMSTGLIYPPCCYADTEELVELGGVLAPSHAPLVVHLRSESDFIDRALEEMLEVGRRSGCPIHISHFKIAGRQNYDRVESLIAKVDAAHGEGITVTADQYPYNAGSTMFGAILPPWVHAGGAAGALQRLRDPAARARIKKELESTAPLEWDSFWKWTGPEGIVISDVASGRRPDVVGKSVAEAAGDQDPIEFALDLLESEHLGVGMVSHSQSPEVVARFARLPWVNGCTDALLGERPHPRAYGGFPRFLERFTQPTGQVPLEEMIRKLTSQAAKAMRLTHTGEIREGLMADLVAFDPTRVRGTATFSQPVADPEGIEHVVVQGQVALEKGEVTGVRAGVVLRRSR